MEELADAYSQVSSQMNPATVQDLTNNAGKVQISHSKMTHYQSDFPDLPCEAEACCDKSAFLWQFIFFCVLSLS